MVSSVAAYEIPDVPKWDGQSPRGPVTEDEVLTVHQRSYYVGWQRRKSAGVGTEFILPGEVPPSGGRRTMAAFRLDPRVLAFARGRATLEDTTLAEVLDRLLSQYAAAPPGTWPTGWAVPDEDAVLDPDLPGPGPTAPSP